MVGELGFEPRPRVPKTRVLPLNTIPRYDMGAWSPHPGACAFR